MLKAGHLTGFPLPVISTSSLAPPDYTDRGKCEGSQAASRNRKVTSGKSCLYLQTLGDGKHGPGAIHSGRWGDAVTQRPARSQDESGHGARSTNIVRKMGGFMNGFVPMNSTTWMTQATSLHGEELLDFTEEERGCASAHVCYTHGLSLTPSPGGSSQLVRLWGCCQTLRRGDTGPIETPEYTPKAWSILVREKAETLEEPTHHTHSHQVPDADVSRSDPAINQRR